ncbi:MAG: hypothetical protein ABIO44_11755 [Saprospiraceae bacterium]
MKKIILNSNIVLFFTLFGFASTAQDSFTSSPYASVLPIHYAANSEPETDLLKNFMRTQFPYLKNGYYAFCKSKANAVSGTTVACSNLNFNSGTNHSELENNSTNRDQLLNGIACFENWDFDASQKLFYNYSVMHPNDDIARYYLGLSQLYRGYYGAAAHNFSLLNKRIATATNEVVPEFKDDVKFYFGISTLMIQDGKLISKSLFKQLDYEGGKYQLIIKGLIDLL